jgi:hypothetical protein
MTARKGGTFLTNLIFLKFTHPFHKYSYEFLLTVFIVSRFGFAHNKAHAFVREQDAFVHFISSRKKRAKYQLVNVLVHIFPMDVSLHQARYQK